MVLQYYCNVNQKHHITISIALRRSPVHRVVLVPKFLEIHHHLHMNGVVLFFSMGFLMVLSKDEHDYFYCLPKLSNNDRLALFELSESDHEEINSLPTKAAKIDYILQLGYFDQRH
jgi:hypothetical protein